MSSWLVTRVLGTIVVLVLIGPACAGSANADAELIAAIEQDFLDDSPVDDVDLDANCMATGFVEDLGGAAAIEDKYGLTAESLVAGASLSEAELDRDSALSLTDRIWGCADFTALIADGLTGGAQGSEEQIDCLLAKIPEDAVKKTVASAFMSPDDPNGFDEEAADELFGALFSAAEGCGLGG